MKKLKNQYRSKMSCGTYLFIHSCVYKVFSTKPECSITILHSIEYREYPLKLRAARQGKNLPEVRHEYPANVYSTAKSWKHNSRRRKQLYRSKEKEMYAFEETKYKEQ